ncbi:hypothetical protein [Aeromicrobium piscarium]|uniref:Major tail protein n=1 Tax=Aeromicrobium piscarium TaxID=2590901 RepID=A0A554SP41_9ACTN|nr:hypothetical protein [Aeromicrobium piscarium]TSD68133.1 hypothetical protein FNM00_00615 [Aeromicrobium piscarium]
MPRSLADGRTKFTLLTTKPANPASPTATELNAGIDASCAVLASDFAFGAAASDKLNEGALCEDSNANTSTRSNWQANFTLFRYYDSSGESAPDEGDDAFQAVKVKGTTLWAYARRSPKRSTEDWADGDEIFLGAEISTDNLLPPSDMGGWIKWRQEADVQAGYPFIEVAAA